MRATPSRTRSDPTVWCSASRERGRRRRLRDVYAVVIEDGVPVVRTDLQTAELAKVSANVMLASRISVVNVLAEVLRGGATPTSGA